MKTAYFDCIAGASGDMILGALVDTGLPLATLKAQLDALHLVDFDLRARRVAKNAFTATKVDVIVVDNVPERRLGDIIKVVTESDLAPQIKKKATAIFRKIGAAEAGIHGTSLDEVHLHELGGVDTIVDVVGALVGLDALGVERVVVSPIPLGRGFIKGAHGQIPLPAPATVALLKGVPIVGSPLQVETVTPTGAALLSSLADDFGPIPPMGLDAIGYGAGNRDFAIPNIIRLLIGESLERAAGPHTQPHGDHGHDHAHGHSDAHTHPHPHAPHDEASGQEHEDETEAAHQDHHSHEDSGHAHAHPHGHKTEAAATVPHHHEHGADDPEPHHNHEHGSHHTHSCVDVAQLKVLETNIDDLNPETYDHVMDALFDAGALDVYFAPIQMKKNRPATLVRVLCKLGDVTAMTTILFRETSTLGIREQTVERHALPRTIEHVDTAYGTIHVKVAQLGHGEVKTSPEHDDCRKLAEAQHVPLRVVTQAAQEAARQRFGG